MVQKSSDALVHVKTINGNKKLELFCEKYLNVITIRSVNLAEMVIYGMIKQYEIIFSNESHSNNKSPDILKKVIGLPEIFSVHEALCSDGEEGLAVMLNDFYTRNYV
jgi:hypothetical protein